MSAANLAVGILFVVFALVAVIPGLLATAGKLPGNSFIGLRVPEVRKDRSTWDQAHRVAGPLWIFAGVALGFASAFAFMASGALWIIPVVFTAAAVVALSAAGNLGARAAALVDASSAETATEPSPEPASEAPQVNLDALRKAAGKADDRN
ncbi:hypothetical protein CAPI_09445 [Corynebacterium capitovis DSM 44611]|uniref:SdpI family protein n=1 Tax=Corynebacterium capitovis TaxID=131081 RepID=UPI00037AF539|nr:SdpI family protein [Corynebacterium capitovis]WKD58412.1 hypothetical protein CAPI_09445 [Corynebacterium capitovis DSM 44611]